MDGERSLKPKYSLKVLQKRVDKWLSDNENVFNVKVKCATPNQSLFYFEGSISTPEGKMIAFTPENFLPRGATMQGTGAKGILALVLYTGNDTKLVLNQGKYKYKTSNTEINLNIIFAA